MSEQFHPDQLPTITGEQAAAALRHAARFITELGAGKPDRYALDAFELQEVRERPGALLHIAAVTGGDVLPSNTSEPASSEQDSDVYAHYHSLARLLKSGNDEADRTVRAGDILAYGAQHIESFPLPIQRIATSTFGRYDTPRIALEAEGSQQGRELAEYLQQSTLDVSRHPQLDNEYIARGALGQEPYELRISLYPA